MPSAGNQLKLSFGINAPESRAIFTGTALPDNSPVGVKLDGYVDYANLVYTGTTTSGTQSWALSEGSVTLTDTKGTLYAYWPYSSTTSIDAIDVDMTAADQTDWLYATPVTGICEDKAEAAVTMNHALANINITINKGSYLGTGAISNITVQSDGIALGGTFNAAQATPDYDAFENEGEPLSRNLSTTTGAATDIMVVPTGASAAITFTATIDGIQFTATSAAVKLEKGNSYVYTLNLSDISTYMTVGSFGVKPWTGVTKDNLNLAQKLSWSNAPYGVYAVSASGDPVAVDNADATCTSVALITANQKIMIAKEDASKDGTNNDIYWGYNLDEKDVAGITNISNTSEPKADFNGKSNTQAIITAYTEHNVTMHPNDMCKVLESFNAGTNSQSNEGYNDWYVPACGQLYEMRTNRTYINAALSKIGGTELEEYNDYWSSSECNKYYAWSVHISDGKPDYEKKYYLYNRVRFIRDIE